MARLCFKSHFSASKLRKPFSVTPTLNISSSPEPSPPKPLTATPPATATQIPPTLAVPWNQGGATLSPGSKGKPDILGRFFSVPFHLTYLVSIKRIVSSRTRLSGLKPWSFYERTADPHRSPRGPRPRPPPRPTRRLRRPLCRRPRPTPPPHPRRKALPPSRRNLGRVLRPQPRRQPPPRRPPHLAPHPRRPHLLRTLPPRRPLA